MSNEEIDENLLKTPSYEIVDENDDFQLRKYKESNWICTKEDERKSMFKKLAHYRQGDNSDELKMRMTKPVCHFYSDDGLHHEMCFYICGERQTDPPKPKSKDLYLKKFPEREIYVKNISGFPSNDDMKSASVGLENQLNSSDVYFLIV
ncbi:hypothetical protein SNEBB_004188 [Seison nebaliae]|nr:hypothetical protein SNEBB_004188 [Seison nebaliae]